MPEPAVTLAPNVYRIPTLGNFINSFAFLEEDGRVTLIDCGLKRAPGRIVAGLAHIGRHPSDVTRIILTHAHFDHAGGAHEMVAAADVAGVEIHEADAPFIRSGSSPPLDQSITSGRLFSRPSSGNFTATAVAQELHDGQVIDVAGGLRVVHTPGHTPGHVSLLHESSGVLITGDAIFNMAARMRWPIAAFCTSFRQNQQSAHVLGELEYDVAAFTHGPEVRVNARETIRGFLARKG